MNMYGMYGDHQYPGFAFGNLGIFAQRMAEFDDLSALPEEVQEEINQHEDESHDSADIRRFAEDLMRRS